MAKFVYAALRIPINITARIGKLLQFAANVLKYKTGVWFLYDPRPDDTFIVTYAKSGTTVMQMMLYQLTTDGSMDIPHIDSVAPWFETTLATDPDYILNLPSPRIFKSHLTFSHLPKAGRAIYVVRNPKDSCLSYYHHLTRLHGDRSSLPQFVRRFIAGRTPSGSWYRHFAVCFPYRNNPHVLFLSYDDIPRDLPGVVEKVAAFCDIELNEERRHRTIERCSIAYMQAKESKFDPRMSSTRNPGDKQHVGFIRKGAVGDWVNELPPQLAQSLEDQLDRTLESLGSDVKSSELDFLKSGRADLVKTDY